MDLNDSSEISERESRLLHRNALKEATRAVINAITAMEFKLDFVVSQIRTYNGQTSPAHFLEESDRIFALYPTNPALTDGQKIQILTGKFVGLASRENDSLNDELFKFTGTYNDFKAKFLARFATLKTFTQVSRCFHSTQQNAGESLTNYRRRFLAAFNDYVGVVPMQEIERSKLDFFLSSLHDADFRRYAKSLNAASLDAIWCNLLSYEADNYASPAPTSQGPSSDPRILEQLMAAMATLTASQQKICAFMSQKDDKRKSRDNSPSRSESPRKDHRRKRDDSRDSRSRDDSRDSYQNRNDSRDRRSRDDSRDYYRNRNDNRDRYRSNSRGRNYYGSNYRGNNSQNYDRNTQHYQQNRENYPRNNRNQNRGNFNGAPRYDRRPSPGPQNRHRDQSQNRGNYQNGNRYRNQSQGRNENRPRSDSRERDFPQDRR